MATLSELLAEDARQYQPGSSAISGEYRGRDAILAFYARLASETNGTFRVVLEGVYTDGEGRVVASSQTTAQRGDRRLDTGAALVFTIKDGKAQDVQGSKRTSTSGTTSGPEAASCTPPLPLLGFLGQDTAHLADRRQRTARTGSPPLGSIPQSSPCCTGRLRAPGWRAGPGRGRLPPAG
jgi:ketosteroid isomerase-like protein